MRSQMESAVVLVAALTLHERADLLSLMHQCRLEYIQCASRSGSFGVIGRVLRDYPKVGERDLVLAPSAFNLVLQRNEWHDEVPALLAWVMWTLTFQAAVVPQNMDLVREAWRLLGEAHGDLPTILPRVRRNLNLSDQEFKDLRTSCQRVPARFAPDEC